MDHFIHEGPNGKHYVMAFQILGVNLLEIIKRYEYKGIPIHLTRILAKQCLVGLDYMHWMCNLIHTDLKPENVVISLTQDELWEIKWNGCLATTKAMWRNQKLKERAVAGANGEVLVSTRNPKTRNLVNDLPVGHPSLERLAKLDNKEKKKYKKKKRKREKKYIEQGRLPADYDNLPKSQKDMLYYAIRSEVTGEEPPKTVEPEPTPSRDSSNSHANTSTDLTEDSQKPTSDDTPASSMVKEVTIPWLDTDKLNEGKRMKWGPPLNENCHLTIVDMGNGCWTHHHFTSQIQTR